METSFINQLASQGLLGLLLTLSIIANWYFIKTIQLLNNKRVEDAKELTSKILDPLNTIKNNSQMQIELLQKLLIKHD